jgi:hypothetical protein
MYKKAELHIEKEKNRANTSTRIRIDTTNGCVGGNSWLGLKEKAKKSVGKEILFEDSSDWTCAAIA